MKARVLFGEIKFPFQKVFSNMIIWTPSILKVGVLCFLMIVPFLSIRAQATETLVSKKDIMLTKALHRLSQKYEVFFSYDEKLIEYLEVDYQPEKYKNIEHALDQLLSRTALKYKIFDHRYIILYEENKEALSSLKGMLRHLETVIDSQENAIPITQKQKPIAYLKRSVNMKIEPLALTVSGTVIDDAGEPLIGVNVQVKGSSKGTATDFDGHFTLEDIDENAILVVSYVGYKKQEVPVTGKSNLLITLEADSQLLDEIIVVGYGTQKKVNVIGSVSSISNEEIMSSPVPNVSSALTGRVPGLTAQQRSGEPGNNQASILIRGTATLGNNSPLVIVDGVQGRDLNSINPIDIESISVLKDASAAIYGARAANGVILVTTKSGVVGSAPKFSYRFYQGLNSPTKLPEMASSFEYASMLREVETYLGIDESNMTFSEDDISKYKSGAFPWTHPNTDWYDESLKDFSNVGDHNFSVSGGSDKVNYYASFGTLNEGGIYTNSATKFSRINLQAKIDIEVNKYFDLGININGTKSEKEGSVKSAYNVFTSVIRNYPYRHAVFPGTNKPGPDIEYGDQPIITPSLEPGFSNTTSYNSYNTIWANFKIPGIEGMNLNAFYSFDKNVGKSKVFEKPYTLYSFDKSAYLAAGNTGVESGADYLIPYRSGTVSEPRLTDSYDDAKSTSLNVRLDYTKTLFNHHNISAFVAYENGKTEAQGISAFRRFFNSDKLPYLFAGGDAQKNNSGWANIDTRVNFISRINYDYNDKYLFQVGFRRDGSLRFSEESGRWGNFPSVLAGWRISEENWWNNNDQLPIDELKLKASWAKMGNDLVPAFQYLSSYGFGSGVVFSDNAVYSPALYQSGTPNPGITWEVANVYNIGVESYLLDYNLNFEVDFFYERRNDILVKRNASVPTFTGLTLPDENFGIVENKGVELVLGYRNTLNNFFYEINTNFSFARNKVIEFDEPERSVPWQVRTGLPQGALLLYKSAGVFSDLAQIESMPHVSGAKPGDIIIEDIDKDGKITADDRVLIPLTANPEYAFGANFKFRYKNIGLTFFVQGVENAIRYIYSDERQGTAGNYFKYDADGRWTPNNINASKPRAFDKVNEYWRQSYLTDYSYHEVGYARLKNLQLSYTIPSSVTKAIKMEGIQIYLSSQNLFLLYNKNPVFDPEVGSARDYPLMRTYSIGGNITF